MFKSISVLVLWFILMALLTGEYERFASGSLVIHSFNLARLFDISQVWSTLHYMSLGIVIIFVSYYQALILPASPVIRSARRAIVLLDVLLISHLIFDRFSTEIQSSQLVAVIHSLIGFATVFCFFWMLLQIQSRRVKASTQTGLRQFSTLLMGLVLIVLLSGIWTSVNNAGLACPDLPQCVAQWWTGLNVPQLVSNLSAYWNNPFPLVAAPESLANIFTWHYVLASVTSALITVLVIYCLFSKQNRAIRISVIVLAILTLLVPALGVIGVALGLPFTVVMAHSAFAAILMLPLIAIHFFSHYEFFREEPEPAKIQLESGQEAIAEADYKEPEPESLLLRLKSQLKRTRSGLGDVFAGISFGQRNLGADLLEELETSLILADVGMDAATAIIKRLKDKLERQQLNDAEVLLTALKQELLEMLQPCSQPLVIPKQDKPYVILVVGINGVGKTTTIGKMAKRLHAQGHSVMLAAGDTFRAAAVEQLQVWGQRNNIHVVAQHTGADSASVIYDGVQSALAKGVDVLIADTAGRLHTKSNLMDELKKVKRIIAKLDETAPHEVLLVLDAGTGQNAISQTALFNEAVALTGLVLTKLDGTAKGGILFALAKQFGLPIRYIGIGEGIDDLQDFDAENFIDALFVKDD